MNPTARTLEALREAGHRACVVERFLHHAMVTQDAFGWIDVLWIDRERGALVGIQCTTSDNMAARLHKARTEDVRPALLDWLAVGCHLSLWGWRKYAKPLDGQKRLWRARVQAITPDILLGNDAIDGEP